MYSVCNLYLKQISFLYIRTLHNDCSHIEEQVRSIAVFGLVLLSTKHVNWFQ